MPAISINPTLSGTSGCSPAARHKNSSGPPSSGRSLIFYNFPRSGKDSFTERNQMKHLGICLVLAIGLIPGLTWAQNSKQDHTNTNSKEVIMAINEKNKEAVRQLF